MELAVGEAATQTGWSARMLRYVEEDIRLCRWLAALTMPGGIALSLRRLAGGQSVVFHAFLSVALGTSTPVHVHRMTRHRILRDGRLARASAAERCK